MPLVAFRATRPPLPMINFYAVFSNEFNKNHAENILKIKSGGLVPEQRRTTCCPPIRKATAPFATASIEGTYMITKLFCKTKH
ncbi:MAG: hypothetical protein HYZ45_10095 [Burkholderiales bacterium]|nr:hypothetical protein [Burkholderiales bacterium]